MSTLTSFRTPRRFNSNMRLGTRDAARGDHWSARQRPARAVSSGLLIHWSRVRISPGLPRLEFSCEPLCLSRGAPRGPGGPPVARNARESPESLLARTVAPELRLWWFQKAARGAALGALASSHAPRGSLELPVMDAGGFRVLELGFVWIGKSPHAGTLLADRSWASRKSTEMEESRPVVGKL